MAVQGPATAATATDSTAAGPPEGGAGVAGAGAGGAGGGTAPGGAIDTLLTGLREPANRVSRRAVSYWTARASASGAVVLFGELIAALISKFPGAWVAVLAVTFVLAAAHAVIMPRWRYRVHRWEVTEDALYTRSGWFSVHWRIAPISRIQTIDSHRSFGERLFGLANVTATTASAAGPVHIHGLDTATADLLLDRLAIATGRSPGDAT